MWLLDESSAEVGGDGETTHLGSGASDEEPSLATPPSVLASDSQSAQGHEQEHEEGHEPEHETESLTGVFSSPTCWLESPESAGNDQEVDNATMDTPVANTEASSQGDLGPGVFPWTEAEEDKSGEQVDPLEDESTSPARKKQRLVTQPDPVDPMLNMFVDHIFPPPREQPQAWESYDDDDDDDDDAAKATAVPLPPTSPLDAWPVIALPNKDIAWAD